MTMKCACASPVIMRREQATIIQHSTSAMIEVKGNIKQNTIHEVVMEIRKHSKYIL